MAETDPDFDTSKARTAGMQPVRPKNIPKNSIIKNVIIGILFALLVIASLAAYLLGMSLNNLRSSSMGLISSYDQLYLKYNATQNNLTRLRFQVAGLENNISELQAQLAFDNSLLPNMTNSSKR